MGTRDAGPGLDAQTADQPLFDAYSGEFGEIESAACSTGAPME